MLILATAAAVQAQFDYVTNADGTTISITGYSGPDVVTIPPAISGLPVTGIGDHAFYYDGLISVTIPSSITNIGQSAFQGCDGLTNLMIPGSVSGIGYYAFYGCSGLTEITLNDGVTTIADGAFEMCSDLTEVTIPGSVASIGYGAFSGCTSLIGISVAAQNSFYSSTNGVLFDKNQTALVEYPGGLVGSYIIPASVVSIGDNAFASCYRLTSVTIPGNVTNVGVSAFDYCSSLSSVTIPASVTSIGENAFFACGLSSVTISGGANSVGVGAFAYCSSLTNATISLGVADIESNAFLYCTALTNVTIAGSVTNIGEYGFENCSDLTQVYFTGNAPAADWSVFQIMGYNSQLGFPYYYYVSTAYYLPGTTGWAEFSAKTGIPAVLWNPLIQAGGASFGVQGNQFGFNVTGTTNIPIVVEVCTNLAQPVWAPLRSMTLTNGLVYFSEPLQTNNGGRFYRISAP
jgi:hypothetical protein